MIHEMKSTVMNRIAFVLTRMASASLLSACFLLGMSSCGKEAARSSSIARCFVKDSCATLSCGKEKLPIDVLYPTDLLAVDTFLLVFQHHEENMIQVYGTESLKHLGSFLKKGSGPNEVVTFGLVSQWYMENGDPKVVIQSYPNYLGILNVREALKAGQTMYDRQYKFETPLGKKLYQASHSVYVLDPDHLMMTKDPLRSGVEGNNNFFWEFYDCPGDKVTRQLKYEDFPWMESFLKESFRAISPDRSRVAVFYRFFDLVTVADLSSGRVTQFLPEGKSLSPAEVQDVDRRCLYYKMGRCTDDYVFGLYAGGLSVKLEDDPRYKDRNTLRIYDWEGTPLYKYDFDERVRTFAVDEQQRYLYAVTDSDAIVRYDLKSLSAGK